MIVATMMHIGKDDPFLKYSHAMESGILFLSLILIGWGGTPWTASTDLVDGTDE